MSTHSLLIVEDDHALRQRLARAFTDRGYDVLACTDLTEAKLRVKESPELALVDLRLSEAEPTLGLEVVRWLVALDPTTRIVMLTGYGSIATAVDAVRAGAVQYLTKPADVARILAAFEGASPPAADTPSLARVEWEHIQRVVHDCGGNVSEAARRLGIHRRSLQRKLGKSVM